MEGLCKPGDVIKGIGMGDSLKVRQILIKGAGWELYQVTALQTGFNYTMKLAYSPKGLYNELKTIGSLHKVTSIRRTGFIPETFLIDQCLINSKEFAFCLFDRCQGMPLNILLGQLKDYETSLVFKELNEFLSLLQEAGYSFTDLRPADILFDRERQKLLIINFSGLLTNISYDGLVTKNRNTWILDNRQGSNCPVPAANLDKVVKIIGVSSLLLFLGSVFYYYF